jgi:hypothetical protein
MYKVQFWSDFHNKWEDYVSINHNAVKFEFLDKANAETSIKQLQRDHPRDKFRVEQL